MGPAVERRKVGIGAEGAVVAAEGGTDVDDVEGAGLEGEGRGAELEGAVLVGVDVGVVVVGGGGGEEEEDARRKKRGFGVWVLDLGGELGETEMKK